MGGVCSTYGDEERCLEGFVEQPEGRRSLGRPRRRLEDNIKMDLQEVEWRAWTGLIWLKIGTGGGHFKFHKMRGIS
jgi:hypothetical protein